MHDPNKADLQVERTVLLMSIISENHDFEDNDHDGKRMALNIALIKLVFEVLPV